MGNIITFPAGRYVYNDGRGRSADEQATIIILPVVRVDRYGEEPRDGLDGGSASRRKGRRPTARR